LPTSSTFFPEAWKPFYVSTPIAIFTDWSITISTFETTRQPLISGVFTAMTLPRTDEGAVDLQQLTHHMEFLLKAGIDGVVLNGATGEYCLTSADELGAMLRCVREVGGEQMKLIAAVGAADTRETLLRVTAAESAGADGLLLPMPFFFPYQQQDLVAYAEEVAKHAKLPTLLYNLPSFTTPLEPLTTLKLVTEQPQIQGIKDSSGLLDTVRLLKDRAPKANRVMGNDSALHAALAEGLCDGVISGVSCVLPELMLALFREAAKDARSAHSLRLKAALDEFIEWLVKLPVPWGLKVIAAERGLAKAEYPLPLSGARKELIQRFAIWFRDNKGSLLA
jgi:4-hydroxy-tetrahydrodipicolinate synthase